MTVVALAVALTLLAVSLVANVALLLDRRRFEKFWLSRETRALDRARASELRAAEQIDAMLDRIGTAPRLDLQPAPMQVAVDPEARKFFADDDDPVEERAWNEYRGEPDEDDSPE